MDEKSSSLKNRKPDPKGIRLFRVLFVTKRNYLTPEWVITQIKNKMQPSTNLAAKSDCFLN